MQDRVAASSPEFARYREGGRLANARRMHRDPVAFFAGAAREAGDFFQLRAGAERIFLVNDAEAIREALVEKKDIFEVGWGSADVLATYLGREYLAGQAP